MATAEIKVVKAQHPDGTLEESSIEVQQPEWKLVFSGAGMSYRPFVAQDLFGALIELRKVLEEKGIRLLCAGARRDVFPSAMSRDMSGGRKAYITKMGCPGRREDLVDIFDYADTQLIGSVSEQKTFHDNWFASLGNRIE
jgi:hypothetical protein